LKLRERLLRHLGGSHYIPATREALAAELDLDRSEKRRLGHELEQLLSTGAVVEIKGDRYCLPAAADLVTGRIHFRASGAAWVVPEPSAATPSVSPVAEIAIAAGDTGTAMHGDLVVVRRHDRPPVAARRAARPDQATGRVLRILERAHETLTGTLQRTQRFYYVAPDDPRIINDIYVPDPATAADERLRAQVGDKVVVRLLDWVNRHVNPDGEIIEVLGRTFEPDAELAALFRRFQLPTAFPGEVEAEVARLPDDVRPADRAGRRDLRDLFTFTIDPDDAKDFDDALSIERLDDGTVRVGVHIADVGAYVKPGTALDREAQRRGNSTYLVGTVIPMLPFKLSNGLCSLREDADRLTKTVFLFFGPGARLVRTEFADSVIRSRKRLTYRQAYALLKQDDLAAVRRLPLPPAHQTGATGRALSTLAEPELRALQQAVRDLWAIASRVRAARMRGGSLELDMPETKIFVDERGYADRLEKIENDESHQLIEEFMLLANEAVARLTRQRNQPSLYRVHDDPDPEKLADLREHLATFGIRTGDLTQRNQLAQLVRRLKEHPQGALLRVQVLRSLKRACYRATSDGHFGLAKRDYTHFTSPIRRYSDLVVHRIFESLLDPPPGAKARRRPRAGYDAAKLERMAAHVSLTEANSTEAERESVKLKLLEFFERELAKRTPTVFAALIVEIRNHGMFVELVDSQAYGLVHLSTLKDDFYEPADDSTALVGRRTKRRFDLGQLIHVAVARVDRFKRQIDFRVVDEGAPAPRRAGPGRGQREGAGEPPAVRARRPRSAGDRPGRTRRRR
jgi:ribonuclease R